MGVSSLLKGPIRRGSDCGGRSTRFSRSCDAGAPFNAGRQGACFAPESVAGFVGYGLQLSNRVSSRLAVEYALRHGALSPNSYIRCSFSNSRSIRNPIPIASQATPSETRWP